METQSSPRLESALPWCPEPAAELAATPVAALLDEHLASSIRELRAALERLVGKAVHLALEIEPGVGDAAVDREALGRVVLELAANARDAMPSGGRLVIAVRDVGHDACRGAGYVGVFVTDDGIGMSEELTSRLLKGLVTTKGASGGRGLGLIGVHRFARAARGCLQIRSAEGVGTTVALMLPRVHTR